MIYYVGSNSYLTSMSDRSVETLQCQMLFWSVLWTYLFPIPPNNVGGVKGTKDISKVDTFEIEERAKHR